MARLLRHRAPLLIGLCLALAAFPGASRAAEPGRVTDAVLAEADGAVVTLGDLALARALSLFGLSPSSSPVGAAELDRYLDALLLRQEAERLRIEVTPEVRAGAWRETAARLGGAEALAAWLSEAGVEEAWARRAVEDDLAVRRLVAIRFRAFAFVSETEVSRALGPGAHGAAARGGMRERLAREATDRARAAWLAERRAQARIRRAPLPAGGYLPPLPMPPGRGRTAP